MYYLGIDLGSSSVKLAVLNAETGKTTVSVTVPETEIRIEALQNGWAEQDPEIWWKYVKEGLARISKDQHFNLTKIQAIGIAYQMHGLVLTDERLNSIRKSILWCDSRAVEIGKNAFQKIGENRCQKMLLGSPGNFTASKLKWVKDNNPTIYDKARFAMLPGDFIAAKLSGVAQTTSSGLSEAALWNFNKGGIAYEVLDVMEIDKDLIPEIVPNFGFQARIDPSIARELGLNPEAKITYRAGDQPSNAYSLNVLNPGEIAATAGTSAVVYAVSNKDIFDKKNRINSFLHVNNSEEHKRNGVMLCVNGSGILYQWLRKLISTGQNKMISYEFLNSEANKAAPGSENLRFYPFGNGVERIFSNRKVNSGIENLNFNIHKSEHIVRSACEGIVFAMNYGFDIMRSLQISGNTVRAGKANLFLSPVFREIFCNTTQTSLELYNTSGAEGAARAAAFGDGFYNDQNEAFRNLKCVERLDPTKELSNRYQDIYEDWKEKIRIEKD